MAGRDLVNSKICPEGAHGLAAMATERQIAPQDETLSLLFQRKHAACNVADGPLLVKVEMADSHGLCSPFWLSGSVLNGQLSLDTPSDMLQRCYSLWSRHKSRT
ncbi:unnamed protein product [Durusdinium trenchii]